MAEAPKAVKNDSAESFLGSVFKYSISSFVNLGIYAAALLLTGLFIPSGVHGQVTIFTQWTNSIMTIAILGLDQSLIRFFYEPPGKLSSNGLFRICFYFSSAALVLGGAVCSTFLQAPIYNALGFENVGHWVIPLLFLNAFFYMVARYFSVLYRMEGNIRIYTIQSILMQFFYKLFYVLGAFFGFEDPVPAMIICSALGLGGFALVFGFARRSTLLPRRQEFTKEGYKAILPYGLMVAPTAVMVTMNNSVSVSFLTHQLESGPAGIYAYASSLSNIVTMVQGGFASFWGPYMFANYKTEQKRIMRVHNYLNLILLVFFCFLVAFEDIIFLILRQYRGAQPIFPIMMLSALFNILCETTVYGNAIAKRPIFDTIGWGLSFAANIGFLVLLAGPFGLHGAAAALALANLAGFLFRTFTAQRLYRSIENYGKTAAAIGLAVLVAAAGTVFAHNFLMKLAACAVAAGIYCVLYLPELRSCIDIALNLLKKLFKRA